MEWTISFSSNSLKFVEKNKINEDEIIAVLRSAILKFQGIDINIDLKKLKGEWFGFFRIRVGKLRIIVKFDFDNQSAHIDRIDWRGKIYK